MKTVIVRHRRENLKKCSLRGLEKNEYFLFHTYPKDALPDYSNRILLQCNAPLLRHEDRSAGLLIIDATWKLAETIERQLPFKMKARSLPPFKTAYPRRQPDCPTPDLGLASIEAIYIAHLILDYSTENLLDHYHWKDKFLQINDFSNFRPN